MQHYSVWEHTSSLGATGDDGLRAMDEVLGRFLDVVEMEDFRTAFQAALLKQTQPVDTYEVEVGFAEEPFLQTVTVQAASATEARRAALKQADDPGGSSLVGVVSYRLTDDVG